MPTDLEKLTVQFTADIKQFEKTMAKMSADTTKRMREVENRVTKSNKAISASFATMGQNMALGLSSRAIAAGAAFLSFHAIVDKLKTSLQEFGNIADKSAQAGLNAEFFQSLVYQASLAGVEMDALSASLNTFSKNAGLAVVGKGKMVQALQALNPALLENIRNSQSQEERVKLAADAIDQAKTASEKAAIATTLFGNAGAALVPVFTGGAASIAATAMKARELGIIIDNELIARADQLGDEFDTATQVMDVQFKQALINLAPILTSTAALAADIASAINLVVDSMRAVENQSNSMLDTRSATIDMQRLENENRILELQGQERDGTIAMMDRAELADLRAKNDELTKQSAKISEIRAKRTEAAAAAKGLNANNAGEEPAKLAPLSTTSAPTRRAAADDTIRQAQAVTELIERLEFEQSLIGKSAIEQEKMNALRTAGAAATDEQKARISALIEETAKEKEALDAVKQSMDEARELGKDVFRSIYDQIREGASAGEILSSVLDKIASKLVDMQINSLFDGGGGAGGLLGSLLGLLGGSPGITGMSGGSAGIAANSNVAASPGLSRMASQIRVPSMPAQRAAKSSITVINNANATVRTEEKQDARGGRMTVFTIDDEIANAIGRPGSASGNAIRARYNATPRIVKR